MNYRGVYVARMDAVSVAHARALVQIDGAATHSFEVIRAWVTFNSITSTVLDVAMSLRTTAGTKTSFTPIRLNGHPTALAGAGTNASVDSTAGDVLWREYNNYLAGWQYLPLPEERIIVPPSGRLAIYLATAPSAVTITAGIVWGEIA